MAQALPSSSTRNGRMVDGSSFVVRDEQADDAATIEDVIQAAFAEMAKSNHREQRIVEMLRANGALSVSVVAQVGNEVIGHCAASPVTISDGATDWYGLGPVSVRPGVQRKGVGNLLVNATLQRLRALGAQGCVVLGHPDYYSRFGFARTSGLVLEGHAGANFFALPFVDDSPLGIVRYHEAFSSA